MTKAYLSLGTNLGDKHRNIAEAIKLIGELVGDVVRRSVLYDTAPWGFSSANRFVNAAVCVETRLSPRRLLETTQLIERRMGRTEKSAAGVYHDRLIDIDILLYGRERIAEPDLKVPHPLMWERDFVKKPLAEILDLSEYPEYASRL